MKYRTLLIDDEPLALQRLERLLRAHKDMIDVIDTASSGAEAVEKIDEQRPDLIFLDIQMPEFNGFEVLEQIQHLPLIIFATAYDEYALQAFETNSIDYLLKPIDPRRLQQALEKLRRLSGDEKRAFNEHLQKLLSQLKPPSIKRIQVRVGNRIRFVDVKDIYFFRALDKYVEVHTFDQKFLLGKSLNRLASELPADDFVRVHRSAIINLNYVDEVYRWFSGTYRVRMKDRFRTELPVSRNSRRKLGLT